MNENAVVTSINICSLKKHFQDMQSSHKLTMSDVICVQETWIEPEQDNINQFQISGFTAHFNSIGGKRGITTYFTEKYSVVEDIKKTNYQITKIASAETEIFNVYRSSNASTMFVDDLMKLVNTEKKTHIIGDFNLCHKSERGNKMIKSLEQLGFR